MGRVLITRDMYLRHRCRSEFNATKAALLPFETRSSDFVISICVKVRGAETENEAESPRNIGHAFVRKRALYSYVLRMGNQIGTN